jgi:5-formyltetrahydrofolate cyclo-ligase
LSEAQTGHPVKAQILSDTATLKKSLRIQALAQRDRAAEAAGPRASLLIARRCLGDFVFMKGAIIAGYAAIKGEADPFPLMAALANNSHALCLPRAHNGVLSFHAWKPGDKLVSGHMGIQEPEEKARERRPDFVIVPLLAFDKNGYRLGYGGGYYDRYLAANRAKRTLRAVGIAYAGQQLDELPHEDFDERLDAVVTEAQVIRFERD